MSALLSGDEQLCYRLYHQTPGLTQKQIAAKIGLNQGQISRILDSARSKVDELKALCRASGGDPDVVAEHLARMESQAQTAALAHTA